jgi:hypothetical protein
MLYRADRVNSLTNRLSIESGLIKNHGSRNNDEVEPNLQEDGVRRE